MNEEWRPVQGYEGIYEVSDAGRIRNVSGRVLKPQLQNGYYYIGLAKDGKVKRYRLHRLVALSFVPNPGSLPLINHKDECKTNNRAENLEWCTASYNLKYGDIKKRRRKTLAKRYNAKRYELDGAILKITTIYTGESVFADLRKLTNEMLKEIAFEEK